MRCYRHVVGRGGYMKIGVLALQGAYAKHREALLRLGVQAREVRKAHDLTGLDAMILPGGESTTMLRLMRDEGLYQPLLEFASYHPTFGTCAGVILLAREVTHPAQESLGLLDISVERNGYGRQIDSFSTEVVVKGLSSDEPVELVFIRAPVITGLGSRVEVLASCHGRPVLVREGDILGATFHPELTSDTRIHRLFLEMVARHQSAAA